MSTLAVSFQLVQRRDHRDTVSLLARYAGSLPNEQHREPPERPVTDEPPPFLGTWSHVYIAVICYLAVLIALFYWFGRIFSA